MRVVIDHVAGTRRGQRQELDATKRIRFGRHPDCEVAFDPHRDIDASSRHAELRPHEASWVLVDLGSSNGTYADGHRITEAKVEPRTPVALQFGPEGPRVRVFVGDDHAIANLQPPVLERSMPPWLMPTIVGSVVFLVVVFALAHC